MANPCGAILRALADPKRMLIVTELVHGELRVGDLQRRLHMSQYNASKHVRTLRMAGIIETERTNQFVWCRIARGVRRMVGKRTVLDFGCCTFRFD